jgi:NAD(P)-dependent dehydrogenase (short-subunit alcohol dehydrogenase family)
MSAGQSGTRLAGRVGLVSGGGQGIGRGTARAIATEGGAVAVLDVDEDNAARTARECVLRGADAISLRCDVSDRDEVAGAVQEVVDRLGGVDLLVTCALPHLVVQPLEVTSAEDLEAMWRVGYLGVVNLMQACLPHLRARRGSIVNFGSGAGLQGSAGYAAYAPIKEAVRTLTRVAAREWGRDGVRVNAICPFARSEQFDEWAATYPEQAALAGESTVLGRVGDCESDVGRAVVYLASDDAAFVTGHTLVVDGGQTML